MAAEPASEGAKSALVVLGMHRSGTSSLSRALSFLGHEQPTDLMKPQRDNPTGFWEADGIVALNASIMDELGFAWDQPKLLFTPGASREASEEAIRQRIKQRHLVAAKDVLARSYENKPCIVMKDPRLCLLSDLWDAALVQSGYQPTYLLIHRNPIEVGQSLRVRNDISAARALQLWLQHNLGALGLLARQQRGYVIAYAELLAQRHMLIERLSEALAIPVIPMAASTRIELDQFLDPGLRHYDLSPIAEDDSPLTPEIVKGLSALLSAWNGSESDKRRQELAALVREFEQHCLFAGNVGIVKPVEEQMSTSEAVGCSTAEAASDTPTAAPPVIDGSEGIGATGRAAPGP